MKPKSSHADFFSMDQFSGPVWTLLAVVAFLGIVSLLRGVVAMIQSETHAHDLLVKVNSIRNEQMQRIAEQAKMTEAIPVDEYKQAA